MLQAQSVITGKVTDARKKPLAGVNITLVGSYDGATTAKDGTFSFTTSEKGERLVTASLTGYASIEVKTDLSSGAPLYLY